MFICVILVCISRLCIDLIEFVQIWRKNIRKERFGLAKVICSTKEQWHYVECGPSTQSFCDLVALFYTYDDIIYFFVYFVCLSFIYMYQECSFLSVYYYFIIVIISSKILDFIFFFRLYYCCCWCWCDCCCIDVPPHRIQYIRIGWV